MEDDFLGYSVVVKDNHPPQRTVKGDWNKLRSYQNGEEPEGRGEPMLASNRPMLLRRAGKRARGVWWPLMGNADKV